MTREMPVKIAADILKEYQVKRAIVLLMDNDGNHHFITYGKNKKECREAGLEADKWKRVFGWPEESLSKYSKGGE